MNAFTSFNLGSEYLALAEPARARSFFDFAWDAVRGEESWQNVGYVPLLASRVVKARREAGDLEGARRAISEGLAAFPDHTDLVYEAALCAYGDGRHEEARSLAERCLEMGDAPARYSATVGSGTFLALGLLAELETAAGRTEAAKDLHRRSLAEHPEYVAPVLPLATLLLKAGAGPAEVLAAIPAERPSAVLLAATACYEAGHFVEAEAWFRQVLERQPANGAARIGLAEALLSQRRYLDAAAEAAREPADSPVAAAAVRSELFALGAAGEIERLRSAARRAEGGDRAFYEAWATALAGGTLPAAIPLAAAPAAATALEALLKVEEIDAFAAVVPVYQRIALPAAERAEVLARIYFRRGFLDSAADEWIDAYERQPEARQLVGLAQVAYAKRLPEDALELARGALQLEPGNEDAARLVRALELSRAA
jgi:tetratricopeptide (TPR) repeat protein